MQTNIIGTYNGSLVALRTFLPEGRGKLINILGRGSDGKPVDMQNGYAASKAWERSFTLSLAKEYKDTGVGIYAINPGMMSTEFLTDLQAVSGYEKRLNAMPTIIRMWATPPEAPARKVVWLARAGDGRQDRAVAQRNGAGQDARAARCRRLAAFAGRPRRRWR